MRHAGHPRREERYKVQVLDRAIGLLETLAGESDGLTPAELSEKLQVHRSTVYRLLMVLERQRFVAKRPGNGKYRLGFRLFELTSKSMRGLDLPARAWPYLDKLVSETGETAHLCILDQGEVLYMQKVEGARAVRAPSIVGRRYPVHCGAAGKALLSGLEPNELDDLIKRRGLAAHTRNTITTAARLKAELQLVRERGYSVDNEEYEEGLRCIGAPVRDYTGKVVAAISIAGPAFRLPDETIAVLASSIVDIANQLSAELGHPAAGQTSGAGAFRSHHTDLNAGEQRPQRTQ